MKWQRLLTGFTSKREEDKTIFDLRKALLILLFGLGMLVIGIRYRYRIHRSMAKLGRVVALVPLLHGVLWTQTPSQPAQGTGQIHVDILQPGYGFNVLPGSVRRVFAKVTGGTTNKVVWTVTGGATLGSAPAAAEWVDVTAPANGSVCTIGGAGKYIVNSATQFTLTARSQENPGEAATITVNVCHPAVQVHVVPFYATLYSGQKADLQAFVWGSTNRDVTWTIRSAPKGGDGALGDADNEDTVFSATVAGRYTLAATSVADSSKTEIATIFVTGHEMPYPATPAKTMPVDCTVDPAMKGTASRMRGGPVAGAQDNSVSAVDLPQGRFHRADPQRERHHGNESDHVSRVFPTDDACYSFGRSRFCGSVACRTPRATFR